MHNIAELDGTLLIAGSESMNWTQAGTHPKLLALVRGLRVGSEKRPTSGKRAAYNMKKNYGVCLGMLAMGLAICGVPVSNAQSRMAANDASAASTESTSTPAATPAASSPADLDRRIEALETELSELKTELAAKKTTDQDAAAPAPAAAPAQAAAAPAAATDKPPDKVTVASLLGPTSLSGFVDVNYQNNLNHPSDQLTALRSFEYRDRSINLNMAELILDKAPDTSTGSPLGRTGYHVSLGFGDSMTAIDSSERASSGFGNNAPGYDQYLKEAYFSYLAPIGSGLQVDVGKFVTPMGAEVIESKDNWNYSRSILFSYAIPYFHFGARAKYNLNAKYNVTAFVVNGWNNIADNNTGKTYGFSFNGNPTKAWTYTINYLAGPELPTGFYGSNTAGTLVNVNDVWRQTWDATVMWTGAKLALMANFDYGRGDRTSYDPTLNTFSPVVYWTGGAGYAKYTLDANDYVAARYEYYEDHDGYTTGAAPHTHFNEVTATYQRTIASYLLARLEYRHDMSSSPYFPLSTFSTPVNYQNTATIGLIFLFDSRNAK